MRKRRRNIAKLPHIHRRTLLVVSIVVLLPWVMIAIPGTRPDPKLNTTGTLVTYEHGWPAIHYVSHRAYVLGQNGVSDFRRSVSEADQPRVWNLAFSPRKNSQARTASEYSQDQRFWSNADRWPTWWLHRPLARRESVLFRGSFIPLGVIVNLIVLLLLCLLVAVLCEWRIARYKRLWRFRLGSLFVITSIIIVLVVCLRAEYRRAQRQAAASSFIRSKFIGHTIKYESKIPEIVLRLLDNRPLKINGVELFRYATAAWMQVNAAMPHSAGERDAIREAWDTLPVMGIETDVHTEPIAEFYRECDCSRLTSLSMGQNALTSETLSLDFLQRMPRLESLSMILYLQSQTDPPVSEQWQAELLQMLFECPNLKDLQIIGIDEHGARVVLNQKQLELFRYRAGRDRSDDDAQLPPDLRQQLIERFGMCDLGSTP